MQCRFDERIKKEKKKNKEKEKEKKNGKECEQK